MEASAKRTGVLPLGEIVAALGGALLLVSLWRPWYELRFPEEVLSQAREFATRTGDLAPFMTQGIDALRENGAIPVTAWQAFGGADTALAIAAGVALGLVGLNIAGALTARLDGPIILAGLVATGLVALRMVTPPGPALPGGGDLLHPTTGLYAGLVGAVLMLVGGLLARSAVGAAAPTPVAPPPMAAGDVQIWDAS